MNSHVVFWVGHQLSEPACGQLLTVLHSSAAGYGDSVNLVVPAQEEDMKNMKPFLPRTTKTAVKLQQ